MFQNNTHYNPWFMIIINHKIDRNIYWMINLEGISKSLSCIDRKWNEIKYQSAILVIKKESENKKQLNNVTAILFSSSFCRYFYLSDDCVNFEAIKFFYNFVQIYSFIEETEVNRFWYCLFFFTLYFHVLFGAFLH